MLMICLQEMLKYATINIAYRRKSKNMEIIKRDGKVQKYNKKKIIDAVKAAFNSANIEITEKELSNIEEKVYAEIIKEQVQFTVENIQDIVEKTLMSCGYYEVAKKFIIYRDIRANKRKSRNELLNEFSTIDITKTLKRIEKKFHKIDDEIDKYDNSILLEKFRTLNKARIDDLEKIEILIRSACELTTSERPNWEYIASMIMIVKFEYQLKSILKENNIKTFFEKIKFMTENDIYGDYILKSYSEEDINYFESKIKNNRNEFLTYSSLRLLLSRYVIRQKDGNYIETPQEMYMGIAMHLGKGEKEENRRNFVVELYDILSQQKVTMATPTMSNSRKPYHQLSSCFIDTVPDSLEGIYRSITNFAKVSKMGGGMGLYFGKVRAAGSDIRGFKGAAGGVVRWIRLVNDTAVAVDQLGMRQGAVAVYIDAWHKDLPEFLQLRTNNGDDRMKAHDVFPALCYPDLFWELARDNINADWHMMCPHEIKTIKGYSLEDFYGDEWQDKYYDCVNDNRIDKRTIPVKDIIRLIMKSAVETGTPFAFFRDTVNKFNTNPDKGIIYCSNLCTEIAQNMEPIQLEERKIITSDNEQVVVEITKPGEFVVCNLASLVLGNINVKSDKEIQHITKTIVRALDNVIDENYYPLEYAKITNKRYRPIGLGVSGYHHMLANNGIKWEDQQHLDFVDRIFEKINFYTIEASKNLAIERGSYELFDGSDWCNGNYFDKRDYNSKEWIELKEEVMKKGIRNSYLIAVAPTSSTSILSATSPGIDPIMDKFFLEEKKGAIIPRVAPNLNAKTNWLYKGAYYINQEWSIRACGIRQRHVDQAQSMNLYITNDYSMRQILNLYILAWEKGVKSIYYIRSKSLEVDECESCSS